MSRDSVVLASRTKQERSTRRLSQRGQWLTGAVVALVGGIILWEAVVLVSDGWAPSTVAIAQSVIDAAADPATYGALRTTAVRVLVAFSSIMLLSFVLGFLMGLSRAIDDICRPLLVVALAIPDPVYFMMALLILGTDSWVPMLALTVGVVPYTSVILRGAVAARDLSLDEMGQVYGISGSGKFRHILVPQALPAIVAAARTTFALTWKVVVLMETLTKSDGLGAEIYLAFRLLDPARMIALSIMFIVLMWAVETVVFPRLRRLVTRWQPTIRES